MNVWNSIFYFVITLYKANYNTNTFDREALASASLNTRYILYYVAYQDLKKEENWFFQDL